MSRMIEAALNGETRVSERGLQVAIARNGTRYTCNARHNSNQLDFSGTISSILGRPYAVRLSGTLKMHFRVALFPASASGSLPIGTIIFAKKDGKLFLEPHIRFTLSSTLGNRIYEPGFVYGIDQ